MQNLKSPAEIEYGWIREARYLPDFGRYEAAVVLHLSGSHDGNRDVELITSVAAHPDESGEALRQRLVYDAARLFRLSDVGFNDHSELPVAA